MEGVARGHRGQTHWNHNHRKLANLITQTTALSYSMKLSHAMWGHPRLEGHGGEVWLNVFHWRREWWTTSVFLPWEPHEQYDKAKWEDTERGTPQVGRCPILLLEISGEITSERMKRWSQSKNNIQLWMWLVIEARSDSVKSNLHRNLEC